jgi:hypothetical protein
VLLRASQAFLPGSEGVSRLPAPATDQTPATGIGADHTQTMRQIRFGFYRSSGVPDYFACLQTARCRFGVNGPKPRKGAYIPEIGCHTNYKSIITFRQRKSSEFGHKTGHKWLTSQKLGFWIVRRPESF